MKRLLLLATLALSFSSIANCNIAVGNTEEMLRTDNTVKDEQKFIKSAELAISTCESQIHGDANSLKAFILLGKKNCQDFGDQRSYLFLGHCYLQLAKTLDQYGY